MTTATERAFVNIYCVGPPLQILGAIEACDRFPANQHVVVIRKAAQQRAEHNRQAEAVLGLGQWDEIISWPEKHKGTGGARQYIRSHCFARSLKGRYHGQTVRLLTGGFNQYSSHLMRSQLRPDHTVLLDDGVATLHHFENHLSHNQYYPDWATAFDGKRGIRQRARSLLSGIDFDVLSEPIDLFTCFDVKLPNGCQSNIFRHSFEKLSEKSRGKSIADYQVFYFGSPLSESGILDFAFETSFIGTAFDHYRSRGLAPFYIPHRDDSQAKLDFLSQAGQAIRRLEMPAEVYFATAPELPARIASSSSTALHNIAMIAPATGIEVLPMPERFFLRKREVIKIVMDHYRDIGIKFVQLDFTG